MVFLLKENTLGCASLPKFFIVLTIIVSTLSFFPFRLEQENGGCAPNKKEPEVALQPLQKTPKRVFCRKKKKKARLLTTPFKSWYKKHSNSVTAGIVVAFVLCLIARTLWNCIFQPSGVTSSLELNKKDEEKAEEPSVVPATIPSLLEGGEVEERSEDMGKTSETEDSTPSLSTPQPDSRGKTNKEALFLSLPPPMEGHLSRAFSEVTGNQRRAYACLSEILPSNIVKGTTSPNDIEMKELLEIASGKIDTWKKGLGPLETERDEEVYRLIQTPDLSEDTDLSPFPYNKINNPSCSATTPTSDHDKDVEG